MNWGIILVFGVAGAVLILSAAMAGSSAVFWYGLGKLVWADLWPAIVREVTKRMPPELEAAMRRCKSLGRRWDNLRKRCFD